VGQCWSEGFGGGAIMQRKPVVLIGGSVELLQRDG